MTPALFFVPLVTVAVLVCFALKRARAALEERFPPIPDAEFLARCTPGTDPEVALKVRRIVAEHFAIGYGHVHPSVRFVEDIGAD
ncbi:MAG TPA: hypothetical protein VGE74_14455 [Gemmata sp.]